MKKYILLFLIAVAGGLAADASSANAQTFTCPYGYTCVPISQAYVPVTCPYGYTCVPINNQYPQYPQYPSYPTYPTNPSNTAGPLRVTSPNGGESFQIGTTRAIQWTSPAYFRATYADIKLTRTLICTTNICPALAYAPYTIASSISISQNSFNWVVGQTVAGNPYNTGSYMTVPDGQYTVQICETGTSNCDSSDSSFTIYSNGYPGNPGYPGNQPPVISGIDAPTSLSVGQTGVWTVRATDSQNGILNYSVDWGDQGAYLYPQSSLSSSGQFTQTTTFTHSYATTGTFTVTFTVRNAAGLTTQSRTTVNVSPTANNNQPLMVISPNGGEIWKRGTQMPITWTTQSTIYPYYPGYNNTGTVRITLNYQCAMGVYCTAIYRPPYIIQNSAPNSGSSLWLVGSATVDGVNAVSVPSGTYVVTVCRYDTSYYGQQAQSTACDSGNSYFTITD